MGVDTTQQLRADIVEVGRRMYARGYTASNDGNISARIDAGRLLMTPKSVCKGFMTPDMLCITDLDGRKLAGDRDPSSEMLMHLEVYRQRPDARAVVHAHPPIVTAFAVAGTARPGGARRGRRISGACRLPITRPSTMEPPEAKARQKPTTHAREPRRADAGADARRVLQDGDDRALRAHQPARADARRRAPLSRDEVMRLQGLRGADRVAGADLSDPLSGAGTDRCNAGADRASGWSPAARLLASDALHDEIR